MLFNYTLFLIHSNTHWSFPFCFPRVGGSIRCIPGLMASIHSDLSPAISILKYLLRKPELITLFHFNPGLPRRLFTIFFAHVFSSCRYRWPESLTFPSTRRICNFLIFCHTSYLLYYLRVTPTEAGQVFC